MVLVLLFGVRGEGKGIGKGREGEGEREREYLRGWERGIVDEGMQAKVC